MDRTDKMVALVVNGRVVRGAFCNTEPSKQAARVVAIRNLELVSQLLATAKSRISEASLWRDEPDDCND